MSLDPFPERIDPRKLFTKNGQVNGVIPLGRLQRLSEYLNSNEGQAEAVLSFGHDPGNRRLLSGSVNAQVKMLCQRCLKETTVTLESELNVLVLSEKQWDAKMVAGLPDDVEAVQSSEEELDVLGLIEDELILSLPIVAHHEKQDCNKELNKLKGSAEDLEEEAGSGAFASLKALREEFKKN